MLLQLTRLGPLSTVLSACAGLTDACSSSNGQGTTDILCRYFILLLVLWVEREREREKKVNPSFFKMIMFGIFKAKRLLFVVLCYILGLTVTSRQSWLLYRGGVSFHSDSRQARAEPVHNHRQNSSFFQTQQSQEAKKLKSLSYPN